MTLFKFEVKKLLASKLWLVFLSGSVLFTALFWGYSFYQQGQVRDKQIQTFQEIEKQTNLNLQIITEIGKKEALSEQYVAAQGTLKLINDQSASLTKKIEQQELSYTADWLELIDTLKDFNQEGADLGLFTYPLGKSSTELETILPYLTAHGLTYEDADFSLNQPNFSYNLGSKLFSGLGIFCLVLLSFLPLLIDLQEKTVRFWCLEVRKGGTSNYWGLLFYSSLLLVGMMGLMVISSWLLESLFHKGLLNQAVNDLQYPVLADNGRIVGTLAQAWQSWLIIYLPISFLLSQLLFATLAFVRRKFVGLGFFIGLNACLILFNQYLPLLNSRFSPWFYLQSSLQALVAKLTLTEMLLCGAWFMVLGLAFEVLVQRQSRNFKFY